MKSIILWQYSRGTWQYDLMCLLIIAFIFLTPKAWFTNKQKDTTLRSSSYVKQTSDFGLAKAEQIKRGTQTPPETK
ncbi:MAG: hypothetical protein ACK5NT_01325 [Pyrinomonadaceae bacterium]